MLLFVQLLMEIWRGREVEEHGGFERWLAPSPLEPWLRPNKAFIAQRFLPPTYTFDEEQRKRTQFHTRDTEEEYRSTMTIR